VFTFQVTPDGAGDAGRFEIKATSRDVFAWEHTGRGRNLQVLNEQLSMTAMYEIAHIAGRRLGLVDAPLAEWVRGHDLDFEQDAEPDPTQPAP